MLNDAKGFQQTLYHKYIKSINGINHEDIYQNHKYVNSEKILLTIFWDSIGKVPLVFDLWIICLSSFDRKWKRISKKFHFILAFKRPFVHIITNILWILIDFLFKYFMKLEKFILICIWTWTNMYVVHIYILQISVIFIQ
jgi:hypothetical protein